MGDLKLHEGWLMGLLRSTRATNQVESLEPRQLLSLAPFTPARSVPGGPYAPAVADAFALAVADNGSFVIAYGTAQHRLMVRRYGVTGDPLGKPVDLGELDNSLQQPLDVAVDRHGDAVVVYD